MSCVLCPVPTICHSTRLPIGSVLLVMGLDFVLDCWNSPTRGRFIFCGCGCGCGCGCSSLHVHIVSQKAQYLRKLFIFK